MVRIEMIINEQNDKIYHWCRQGEDWGEDSYFNNRF